MDVSYQFLVNGVDKTDWCSFGLNPGINETAARDEDGIDPILDE